MFTCFNTEISHINALHQKIEKEVPASSSLEKRIGCIAVSALEAYACSQFMCGEMALCNVCYIPIFLLDQEHNPLDLLSSCVLGPVLSDIDLPPVGFKKSECCRTAKVAGLTLKEYTKAKCCPSTCSMISKDVRYEV